LVETLGLFIAYGTNNVLNDFSWGIDKDKYIRNQFYDKKYQPPVTCSQRLSINKPIGLNTIIKASSEETHNGQSSGQMKKAPWYISQKTERRVAGF
jgi:hypothetical protein